MNNIIPERLQTDVRALYERDELARAFFNWAANRTNDAAQTNIDRIAHVTGFARRDAMALAKELSDLGCGEFVVGRKGWKTRIYWSVSLRSLGKVARGDDVPIEEVDPDLREEADDQDDPSSAESQTPKALTIAEAKRLLAEALGIGPDAIEITIKA